MAVASRKRSGGQFRFTLGDDVAAFFERNFRHTKGPMAGHPFVLEPPQREFIDEFFRCDADGRRLYRTALEGMPRGNGKTPKSAGLAIRDVRTRRDSPDVFCGAAARDQGRILLDFARDFVETGPLIDRIRVQRNQLYCERTRGVMQVVSADGALQHGKSVSGWYPDELHAFTTPKQRELHVAMMTALFKRSDSTSIATTTAGWDKATLLGEMYDSALTGDVEEREDGYLLVVRDEENGSLFWWRAVPSGADIEDPEVLRRANPASWVDVGELLRILRAGTSGIGEAEFRRLHCNQWTASHQIWVNPERWAACRDDSAEIPDGARIAVAVDAALTHDTTAVSWAHKLEDGRVVLRCHVWAAREGVAAHEFVAGGRIRNDPVKAFIRQLGRRYQVVELVYDPRFFEDSAMELSDEGFMVAPLVQSAAPMRDAEQQFHDAAVELALAHDGDKVLAAHVAATTAERTDRGWKIRKLRQSQVIDGLVAAVMAHYRARRFQVATPWTGRW